MFRVSVWPLITVMSLFAGSAQADSHAAKIGRVLPEFRAAVVQQDTIDALRRSNRARATLNQTDISRLTATWEAELTAADHPLISSVIDTPLAMRLRRVMEDSNGMVNEIGIIGANGLEIAQTNAHSDYWQGGDERFAKTFGAGPDAEFVDMIEYDSPTQSIGTQANFSVADPDTGEVIGSVTIHFNLASLE